MRLVLRSLGFSFGLAAVMGVVLVWASMMDYVSKHFGTGPAGAVFVVSVVIPLGALMAYVTRND